MNELSAYTADFTSNQIAKVHPDFYKKRAKHHHLRWKFDKTPLDISQLMKQQLEVNKKK